MKALKADESLGASVMNWKTIFRVAIVVAVAALDLYCGTRKKRRDGLPVPDLSR